MMEVLYLEKVYVNGNKREKTDYCNGCSQYTQFFKNQYLFPQLKSCARIYEQQIMLHITAQRNKSFNKVCNRKRNLK